MARKVTGLTKEDFASEAQRLVTDLAFYAGRPVRLRLTEGDHIAYTYNTEDTRHVIDVVLNPDCVKNVRTRERAVLILRGIGYHELLHHLHPAEEQYKRAHELGFKSLFNLIDDEQNERRGASQFPEWGAHFQSVCAFIFPTAKRKDSSITTGIADGGASPEDDIAAGKSGFGAHETYRLRWNEFAYHLRRHIPHPRAASVDVAAAMGADPATATEPGANVVASALARIPGNFRELSKEDLFELTREIQGILTSGLDLPAPPVESQRAAVDNSASPSTAPTPAEAPKEPPSPLFGDPDKPLWERLLTSKWSWITLALALTGWAALFARGGSDLWFVVAMWVLGIGGTVVGLKILSNYLRRLMLARKLKKPEFKLSVPKGQGWWSRMVGAVKGAWSFTWSFSISLPGRLLRLVLPGALYLKLEFGFKFGFKLVSQRASRYIRKFFAAIGAGFGYIRRAVLRFFALKIVRIVMVALPLAALVMML